MTDFEASFAKLKKRCEGIQEERQRKWEIIKTKPEMAQFLTEISREFGKPVSVQVKIKGFGRVL